MWKILVVEDDFVNRKLVIEILREKARCDVAVNGTEALQLYEYSIKTNNRYDAILLDIAMPGVDGLTVLKKIRQAEKEAGVLLGDGIPIIMVTAYKEQFLNAFNQGCDDYVVKPIDASKLLAKLEEKIINRK